MAKPIYKLMALAVFALLVAPIGVVSAATPAEVMAAITPYLTESNKLNPTLPLVQSQEMNGKVYIYRMPTNPVVYVYTSSASIDCDGQATLKCTGSIDPQYQGQTSFTQSDGKPLNAEKLPWYVLPETPNPIFDYAKLNIYGGQAGLVIYNNKMEYGVFGDERGRDSGNSAGKAIGEVSYAMAVSLGINPDPANGGVDSGVTYLVFTTKSNVVNPIENHAQADIVGGNALNLMISQLKGTPTITPKATPAPTPTSTPKKPTHKHRINHHRHHR